VYTEISSGALKPGDRVIIAETGKTATPLSPASPGAQTGAKRGMGF
jgi:hypothetical protein